jgi:CheY-like chemotaxis protein
VSAVSRTANPVTAQKLAGAKLFWVDNRPENNTYERKALEEVGIQITLSKSIEDALEKLRTQPFDVVISAMGRQPLNPQAAYESRAGYTLLDTLRAKHILTPYIIYAGSDSEEDQAETKRHGGYGATNNPHQLFLMVIDAIQQG